MTYRNCAVKTFVLSAVIAMGVPIALYQIHIEYVVENTLKTVQYPPARSVEVHTTDITTQDNDAPARNIVFLKTHKTGSTTLAGIIQRYGYKNGLNFVVPECSHIISDRKPFSASHIARPHSGLELNILTNHIRFNRTELDKVFKSAKYVTIIRDAVTQFESAFTFFRLGRHLPANANTIDGFLNNPQRHFSSVWERSRLPREAHMYHNFQIYDLGLELDEMNNSKLIDRRIKELDKEFDLIMINEYFDESLVLLKKLLNWSTWDITYLQTNVRRKKLHESLNKDNRNKVRAWNSADDQLYIHFNKTFWRKVAAYGENFRNDLEDFRKHQSKILKCFNEERSGRKGDTRVIRNVMKDTAPKWCKLYLYSDITMTKIIRERMRTRKLPLYDRACKRRGKIKSRKSKSLPRHRPNIATNSKSHFKGKRHKRRRTRNL